MTGQIMLRTTIEEIVAHRNNALRLYAVAFERIKDGARFSGRKMLVGYIRPLMPAVHGSRSSPSEAPCAALIEGRLDGRSKAGDGWMLRYQTVAATDLEPL